MKYTIRLVNANIGGAISLRDALGSEQTLAVFADAAVEDFAFSDDGLCVLISRKRGVALLDTQKREIVERTRLSFQPDGIVVSPDGRSAVAWSGNPGQIGVLDLPSLSEIGTFNLAERRADGGYELVHRTDEDLRELRLQRIHLPFSDGPLCQLRFTKAVRPVFRGDGRLVLATEHSRKGPDFVWDHINAKPLSSSFFEWTVGVAVLDLDAARAEFRPIRRIMEPTPQCHFAVRAFSPDGRHAMLHSASLVEGPSEDRQPTGTLARVFGRRSTERSWAYGLELWDVGGEQPERASVVAFHPFRDDGLMHPTTFRLAPTDAEKLRPEIDLVVPGMLAVLSGRAAEWEIGAAKRAEDAYFVPRETATARPAFRPGFGRVADPLLFGAVMRTLLSANPHMPQDMPWAELSNRQKWFMSHFTKGWDFHAKTPVMSATWTADPDRVVAIGRDGTVREVSFSRGPGAAFTVQEPPQPSYGFDWRSQDAKLIALGGRAFAVDYYSARFEFDLPESPGFGPHNLQGAALPLPIRVITDAQQHRKEVAAADRLTRAIRPGYVTIAGRESAQIAAGLETLAQEVRASFDEIVVDNRWAPALFLRGKAIEEKEFCDILVREATPAGRAALETLLAAWLERTAGSVQPVWHPDDETPTMGPTALALVQLCDPAPESVMSYFAGRDADHDGWTPDAWQHLALSPYRLAQPDMIALRTRLALQDISTGNVGSDLFGFYDLDRDRARLRADPTRAEAYASIISTQARDQWPELAAAGGSRPMVFLSRIVDAMDTADPGEAALATTLREQLKIGEPQTPPT